MLHLVFWKIFGLQARETRKEWQKVRAGPGTMWREKAVGGNEEREVPVKNYEALLFLPPKAGHRRTPRWACRESQHPPSRSIQPKISTCYKTISSKAQ